MPLGHSITRPHVQHHNTAILTSSLPDALFGTHQPSSHLHFLTVCSYDPVLLSTGAVLLGWKAPLLLLVLPLNHGAPPWCPTRPSTARSASIASTCCTTATTATTSEAGAVGVGGAVGGAAGWRGAIGGGGVGQSAERASAAAAGRAVVECSAASSAATASYVGPIAARTASAAIATSTSTSTTRLSGNEEARSTAWPLWPAAYTGRETSGNMVEEGRGQLRERQRDAAKTAPAASVDWTNEECE